MTVTGPLAENERRYLRKRVYEECQREQSRAYLNGRTKRTSQPTEDESDLKPLGDKYIETDLISTEIRYPYPRMPIKIMKTKGADKECFRVYLSGKCFYKRTKTNSEEFYEFKDGSGDQKITSGVLEEHAQNSRIFYIIQEENQKSYLTSTYRSVKMQASNMDACVEQYENEFGNNTNSRATTFVQHPEGHTDICIIETAQKGQVVVMIIAKPPVTPGEKPVGLKVKPSGAHGERKRKSQHQTQTNTLKKQNPQSEQRPPLPTVVEEAKMHVGPTQDNQKPPTTPELTTKPASRWHDRPQCASPINVSPQRQYYQSYSHVTQIE
jgi:hypothetical protein